MLPSTLFHRVLGSQAKNCLSLLKSSSNASHIATRRALSYRSLIFWKRTSEELKIKDQVEKHYQLVYKADNMYEADYINRIASVTGIPCILSFLISSPIRHNILSLGTTLEFCVVSLFGLYLYWQIFTFATVYVLRIYYSEESDKYIAILANRYPYENRRLTISPGQPVHHSFKMTDSISLPYIMFKDNIYDINSTKIIFTSQSFSRPYYYNRLVGY